MEACGVQASIISGAISRPCRDSEQRQGNLVRGARSWIAGGGASRSGFSVSFWASRVARMGGLGPRVKEPAPLRVLEVTLAPLQPRWADAARTAVPRDPRRRRRRVRAVPP